MRYCIDTNIIIDFFRGDHTIQSKMQGNKFCINVLILCELYKGAYLAAHPKEALSFVEEFAQSVEILDFNTESCEIFGELHAGLTKKGKQTQEIDLMIASIAIAHRVPLITRNKKDFVNIPGLDLIEW